MILELRRAARACLMGTMKIPAIALMGLLLCGGAVAQNAEPDARIAALEATVARLETQNLSLRAAVEAIAGKSLAEILGAEAAAPEAAPTPAPAPRMVMGLPEADARARLTQIDAQVAAMTRAHEAATKAATKPRDPFADRGGIRKSPADLQKEAAARIAEIARVRAQAEALRAALAAP